MWGRYGRQIFESFLVPTEKVGFASLEKGFLWFELYPTTPGTSMINGQFQAISGLAQWGKTMNEPHATALVNESLSELDTLLPASEVEDESGLMASYELLRGYPAAPLRLVGNPEFRLDEGLLNGELHDDEDASAAIPRRHMTSDSRRREPDVRLRSSSRQATRGPPGASSSSTTLSSRARIPSGRRAHRHTICVWTGHR